jgi:2-(1,2-epoxy-1,2-dihydrophenyl)acetyl-CoA isomerase
MTDLASPIDLRRDGNVAIITLNRPDAANAIDIPLADALGAAARRLDEEGWARAIVLRGEGRLFCGGGDVAAMGAYVASKDGQGLAAFIRALVGRYHDAVLALLALDAPIIAAVHGVAAGAGMSIALSADLAYGSPKARFVPAYPGIGFAADGGMTWFLTRTVGERKAAELILMNEPIDARRAVELGLLTGLIEAEGAAFDAEVLARARKVAEGPRRAFGHIRRLLRRSAESSLAEQLDAEGEAMVALAAGADVAEGLQALSEKRKPRFEE